MFEWSHILQPPPAYNSDTFWTCLQQCFGKAHNYHTGNLVLTDKIITIRNSPTARKQKQLHNKQHSLRRVAKISHKQQKNDLEGKTVRTSQYE